MTWNTNQGAVWIWATASCTISGGTRLLEMTMIKRWSKPKSFSGGGTPQPLDDLVDPISKCTFLAADMDQSRGLVLRLKSGTRAGQVQRRRLMELNSSGSTIRRTLEDKPEKVVERVATKNILDSAMRAALEARIRKEMDKRRDKRWVIFSNSRLWLHGLQAKMSNSSFAAVRSSKALTL